VTLVSCTALLIGTTPEPLWAQAPPPPPSQPAPAAQPADSQQGYSVEQLDALLAPIALYPDQLLTQILMASAYPLQVVEAARWVDDPAHKALTGDALAAALGALDADKRAENARAVPGDLAAAASLSAKLEKYPEAWGFWRRSFDSAMSVDDAVSVRKALNALIALAPKLEKDVEGTRYAALLAKLDEAEGKARVAPSP